MKLRTMFFALLTLLISLSLTFAHGGDAAKKNSAGRSCCKTGTAEISSTSVTPSSSTIVLVNDKKVAGQSTNQKACPMTATAAAKCTEAEKAHCTMKASMMKDGKMDCCKGATKAKISKAGKKPSSDKSEAKGTN